MPEPSTVDGYTLQDPATGRPREFHIPAVQEGAVDPKFIEQIFRNRKIAEAEKAMAAAIQFQGLRGYQQALDSGKPASEALTRYGPMMFYSRPAALGPAVRAMTPPADLYRGIPRGGIVRINPPSGKVTTIREQEPAAVKAPRRFSAAVDVDPLGMREPSRLSMTGDEFGNFIETAPPQVQTNAVNLAIQRMRTPTTNAPVATATNVQKTLRVVRDKDGKLVIQR